MKVLKTLCVFCIFLVPLSLAGQEENDSTKWWKKISVNGSIQSDILIPIGNQDDGSHENFRTNTFAEVSLRSLHVDAGLRMEYLEHPLPGFEKDYKGWGFPYFYIKGKLGSAELTIGSFYDQFGSGLIYRTYEERSLGIDNSLLGARLSFNPIIGVSIKALTGKQRCYWEHNDSWITGVDTEFRLNDWIKGLNNQGTSISLGASWVNKYENENNDEVYLDPTKKLALPKFVNAFDVRLKFQKKGLNILSEYALKTQDPSFDNDYIYRKGYVTMLSASFSQKGFSFLVQAKRSDNFSFRSKRSATGTSSYINYLPAFTEDQTYTLAALYPYATNPIGEWAYQGQVGYYFKKKTTFGGKYGMRVKLNFSHIHAIQQTQHGMITSDNQYIVGKGTKGYGSAFWKWGDETYYQDFDIQIEKRINRNFKINLMYMNQYYNKTIIEGEGGMVHSDIFVFDGLYSISKNTKIRSEIQYLSTKNDVGDWAFGLVELSLPPHWLFSLSDTWNCGVTNAHYWQINATYNLGSHRMQLGWGRTRAGYNCSGGVCRYIPETKGFTFSYNYNF